MNFKLYFNKKFSCLFFKKQKNVIRNDNGDFNIHIFNEQSIERRNLNLKLILIERRTMEKFIPSVYITIDKHQDID